MYALLLVLGAALLAFYNCYYKRRHLPPGPTPLPLVGNVLSIGRNPPGEAIFLRWAREYGPVYTYWLGELPLVVVTDHATMVDTFQRDGASYEGRPHFRDVGKIFSGGGENGVLFTQGELWREQRRFALHVLRDFGLGKNLMQDKVLVEVACLVEKVEQGVDAHLPEHNIASHIDMAVGSIINALLFNYRFHGEHEHEFGDLKKRITEHMMLAGQPMMFLLMLWPWLKHVPFVHGFYERLVHLNNLTKAYFEQNIVKHQRAMAEEEGDSEEPPKDYVEAFLREKAKRELSGGEHHYTMDQLKSMIFDLWSAGQETTSNTIAWGVAHLIHHPDVQAKLHEELDAVVGSDRVVTVAERPHLPYTGALINEIQRVANLVPMNIMHRTTKQVTISGYSLPEGTTVVPQISTLMINEQIFPDPSRFDPSRFLDESGRPKRVDELIPFSLGKRQCLGESLARMELFLFVANIFNRFRISGGESMPSLERRPGATVQCPPFTCRIEKRHQ